MDIVIHVEMLCSNSNPWSSVPISSYSFLLQIVCLCIDDDSRSATISLCRKVKVSMDVDTTTSSPTKG